MSKTEVGLPGDYVTIREACELAGVKRRTIHQWMHDGKITYVRTGGQVRILRASLLRPADAQGPR